MGNQKKSRKSHPVTIWDRSQPRPTISGHARPMCRFIYTGGQPAVRTTDLDGRRMYVARNTELGRAEMLNRGRLAGLRGLR